MHCMASDMVCRTVSSGCCFTEQPFKSALCSSRDIAVNETYLTKKAVHIITQCDLDKVLEQAEACHRQLQNRAHQIHPRLRGLPVGIAHNAVHEVVIQ